MPVPDPTANRLIASLIESGCGTLLPHLKPVEMPLGMVLYQAGVELKQVYFPTTALVSLMYELENGATAETAVVGLDGVVGVSAFMGGDSTPGSAVVLIAGHGFSLATDALMEEFHKGGPLQQLLLRYTQALLTQMSQTAVCNRHHTIDQQLCRWLLLSLDRLSGSEVLMTQSLIADNLGVRREGVTEAALSLQKSGLISYSRGHIDILDRPGLEQRSCECYAVVKAEYDLLLATPEHLPVE